MSALYCSIIIPARNEQRHLPSCLEAIQESAAFTSMTIEVIVVINRCTDQTENIARQAGCKIVYNDSKNLAQIRNAGASVAQGDIIVTVDADSVMSLGMLKKIKSVLDSNKFIGGGVAMLPSRYSTGILLTAFCLLPLVVFHRISGGLFYCLRQDFEAIGGFNESLSSVEDIDFARRLRKYGRKQDKRFTTIWSEYIRTSCRKFDRLGDWYFLLHPFEFMSLLRGRNQAAADKVWYDFER
jgi:glycosyltransferase involved in cell wall biosynthesis